MQFPGSRLARAGIFSLLAIGFAAGLSSCGGGGGKPAAAPANVVITPLDGGVELKWDQQPGLTYWAFSAAAPSITRENYNTFPQARISTPINSPQIIGGLANGTTYSFVINATSDGSGAGPASPSVSAAPRLAGINWVAGTPISTANYKGIAVGAAKFVAVGSGGALSTSTDLITWTAGTSTATTDLNSVFTGSAVVAVGNGGTIISSPDAVTWTARTSGTSANLNAGAFALNNYVVVGAGGTILTSTDFTTWTARTSGTARDLYGVAYLSGRFVAVGAGGTLLTSTDSGVTWVAQVSNTTADLRSATFGVFNATNIFVAVGAGGAIVTSADGVAWTARTSPTTNALNSVATGSQFVAAGVGGTVLYSPDGVSWSLGTSGTTADLNAAVRTLGAYVAVGAQGANVISR